MSKKKKQGKVRHIAITPSKKDVESNITDQLWFEQHPEYGHRLRAYIPGEFDGMPSPENAILDDLEYVYVKNLGVHRARIPYTLGPLDIVTLIILGSVDEDDLNTVVSTARQLTTHAEVVPDPEGKNRKLLAYCTEAQKPAYEDFIQCVFVGAKRYEG